MKIFFNASVSGRKFYQTNYQWIYDCLKNHSDHVTTFAFKSSSDAIAQETLEDAEEYFSSLHKTIQQSEIGVFEVSYPSLGIGYEIARFCEDSKPVIALHVAGKRPYILESMRNDKLQVIEYNIDSLSETIVAALEYAQDKIDTRFTMLLPPDITSFLNQKAEQGINRSEFIRQLIREKMREQ